MPTARSAGQLKSVGVPGSPAWDTGVPECSRRGATVVSGTSPVARQRELGTRLRALRSERGMTVEEVAAELLCSTTKISRLETAARRPSLRDVRDLCVLYEIDEQTSRELMSLAREAREPGWWTEYADLNLDPLIGLEQEAVAITCYSINYIPGLLQTRDYAEGIIRTVAPKMDPHVVQQRIEARLRRQRLLEEDDRPRYHVVLDEAVYASPRRWAGAYGYPARQDPADSAHEKGACSDYSLCSRRLCGCGWVLCPARVRRRLKSMAGSIHRRFGGQSIPPA